MININMQFTCAMNCTLWYWYIFLMTFIIHYCFRGSSLFELATGHRMLYLNNLPDMVLR
jgi:hypothetical protein